MEAAASELSITTSPLPALEGAQTPLALSPPPDASLCVSAAPSSVWPRSAQLAAAASLVLTLSLVGWHVWNTQRSSCRPAILETDAFAAPALDLNHADRAQLLQLPGVGENLAQRIETYRAAYHGFHNVDELGSVQGVGPRLLEKLRPHVYVEPDVNDESSEPARQSLHESKSPPAGKKKTLPAKPIDINHATAAELQRLPGIGPVLAERIVQTRSERPFRTVEDLRRVKGIGPRKLNALRPHVVISK